MKVWVDGSVEPGNPGGIVGFGWHLEDETEGYGSAFRGGSSATNNVSEYFAVLAFLIWLLPRAEGFGRQLLTIYSDSQLVVNQLSGEWRVRHANVKPVAAAAHMMVEQLNQLGLELEAVWIPREENKRADKLSRRAVNEHLKDRLPLSRRER